MQQFNTIKDLEMNKVYEFNEKLGKRVYIMKTVESERMNKVVEWFAWPNEETGKFEEEQEEERTMIGFETFKNLLESKRIILK